MFAALMIGHHFSISAFCKVARLPPGPEIDGVGADPTKAFSGAAGRFREATTDVVAWQSDEVSFS
jgi:hypothetical protein